MTWRHEIVKSLTKPPRVVPPPASQAGKPPMVQPGLLDSIQFAAKLGPRLFGEVPPALMRASARCAAERIPERLTDARVIDLHLDTVLSRRVIWGLSDQDIETFSSVLGPSPREDESAYFLFDYSAMACLHLLPEVFAAPVVALGRVNTDGYRELLAIQIAGMVLTDRHTDAWALSRYFIMQAAGLHGVLVTHVGLHFQLDVVNANTKSQLAPDHPVRVLLEPHQRYSLGLNREANFSPASILTNNPLLPFATFPCDRASVYRLQATGHEGYGDERAYPPGRFTHGPPELRGPLGDFLRGYYRIIHSFVDEVLRDVVIDDSLRCWADDTAKWLPGFPDASELEARGVLAHVVATCISAVTVVHAAEHWGLFEDLRAGTIPLKLRVPPPISPEGAAFDLEALTTFGDRFRQNLAWEFLIRGRPATRLDHVTYAFRESASRDARDRFVAALEAHDAALEAGSLRRFVPLWAVGQSIQF